MTQKPTNLKEILNCHTQHTYQYKHQNKKYCKTTPETHRQYKTRIITKQGTIEYLCQNN